MRRMMMAAAGALLLGACNGDPQLSAGQVQANAAATCAVYGQYAQARSACTREYVRVMSGGQPDATSLYIGADMEGAYHCTRIGTNSAHPNFSSCVANYRSAKLQAGAMSAAISAATPASSRPVVMPSSPTTCHGMTVGTISTAHCF